ncbi:MAG: hypothetical protein IJY79_02385 [Clostridia bacterium]|nr:hypothetical protein [Clostridia bacterium]
MVKGVNKTVIEVNNTGSKVFDRIVFYVSPACSNLSAKNLNRAIKNFTFLLDERAGKGYKTLRQQRIVRRRVLIGSIIGVAAIAFAITLTMFL